MELWLQMQRIFATMDEIINGLRWPSKAASLSQSTELPVVRRINH